MPEQSEAEQHIEKVITLGIGQQVLHETARAAEISLIVLRGLSCVSGVVLEKVRREAEASTSLEDFIGRLDRASRRPEKTE